MTGTGSGNSPVLYTNGVDTNINLGIMPKGTGGVGIGTVSPGANLDIEGTNNIELQIGGSNTTGTAIQLNDTTTGAHNYQFFVTGSANAGGAGLSGVYDATTFNVPLAIYGGTSQTAGQYIRTSANGVFGWSNSTYTGAATGDTGISRGAANTIYVGNGTQGNYSGTLIAGSVGIGTTSLQTGYILTNVGGEYDTQSSSSYAAVSGTNSGTGSGYGIYGSVTGAANTGYAGYFNNTATTTNYGIYSTIASTTTGAAVYGTITGIGNTGYAGYFTNTGTGAVNYGLYAGTSSTTGYAGYFAGNLYSTGTVFGLYLQLTSDRRMKKNIRTLDPAAALDKIAALRPVTFEWRKDGKHDMGLIGQEIAPVYPELVGQSADGKFSVEYVSLIAPLIASVQELKKLDEELDAENQALRRDFDAYKETHP